MTTNAEIARRLEEFLDREPPITATQVLQGLALVNIAEELRLMREASHATHGGLHPLPTPVSAAGEML